MHVVHRVDIPARIHIISHYTYICMYVTESRARPPPLLGILAAVIHTLALTRSLALCNRLMAPHRRTRCLSLCMCACALAIKTQPRNSSPRISSPRALQRRPLGIIGLFLKLLFPRSERERESERASSSIFSPQPADVVHIDDPIHRPRTRLSQEIAHSTCYQ